MQYVLGAVFILAGTVLGVFAVHGIFHRPGWDRPYSVGALLAYVAGFLVLGGILNLYLAARR